ncbi:MAG: TonB-dependent receptor [Ferruginibacter sp.]
MNYLSHKSFLICFGSLLSAGYLQAQVNDTLTQNLSGVSVTGYKAMNGIGHFDEVNGPIIYAGKKTELIEVDSIDANKAINNTRQILGRIPGLNIVESETGGFVANGIGMRGLNPVQSLEMNVRQNGYNVAADVYGYNETYYLPPMEAVARVELVKGASGIQFGAQLGGMVNYVLKDGDANKPVTYSTMQTAGSDGLFNSYHAVGGTYKNWKYFGFINYRTLQGWRPNSQQQQLTGYGKLTYKFSEKATAGIEYSLLRNKIKMPGGLTDDQFEADSKTSVRSRNWLKSPWNVVTVFYDYNMSRNTSLHIKSAIISGQRSLVWVNKLPGEPDIQDPSTGQYPDREVDQELMKSLATELRLIHVSDWGSIKNTFATGIRFAVAGFDRNEEAPGTNASDFDLSTKGEYEENFHFSTTNIAAFIESAIQVNKNLSIVPGIRFESLESEAEAEIEVNGIEKETETEKSRSFILMALGLQYKLGKTGNIYGNISQSYRPVDYAQLVPFGTVSKVDPDMKDPKGWNSDLGINGNIQNLFNYDVSLFYLAYNNRIGTVIRQDENGQDYNLRTNTDKSIHKGIESYLELNITGALKAASKFGAVHIYNSFAYTNAKYAKGMYKGNKVEYAPEIINRIGLSYSKKWLKTSIQFSEQSDAFSDAANTVRSSNPLIGKIPGYAVLDWSFTLLYKKMKFKGGVNNVTDKRYFTQRTDEYPGPGIIPSTGRSFYVGIGMDL